MHDDIDHRIERTRNKHSRAVYRDGTVIIRLARDLSDAQEHEHVESLLRRMAGIVRKERERLVIDPFRPLLRGETSTDVRLPDGTVRTFQLLPGTRTKAYPTALGWRITVGPRVRRAQLHRFLWTVLAKGELPRLKAYVERLEAETFGMGIRGVRLRYASSLWGSCSPHGDVMLNAVLLLVPESLLRYVIIHELAHRVVRNHSRRFWMEVERFVPDQLEIRRTLRNYRICSL